MNDKFSLDELAIRVMPGGAFLAFLYFYWGTGYHLNLSEHLDVLLTFLFFCVAFIVGEVLQTLAHECEWMIDLFFKCRRPSRVFLYKNNPVVRNELRREEIIASQPLTDEQRQSFETEYSELSVFSRDKEREQSNLSQAIFWKLYSQVINSEEIRVVNRNYLFVRVMMIEFMVIAFFFFVENQIVLGGIGAFLFLVFLWRARGLARGLVFKTLVLNQRGK